ncbi:M23 family metallopeptidase [Pseudonocardia sp. MH-G8]|uniref:M23 family metallopeptidase n=1 Tax=Pseudonocardia sp. MH-G8 TaxID=1854588 RepID=UPI001E5BF748|nr:M23 family metallopeptidase [Pseudonocardia sp. MH-G8]
MARHRSPQGRRAHLGPPLSAAMAAAGVGGAHRSISVPQLSSSLPARFVATVVTGGALAATAQHALAETLPAAADTAALRVAVEEMIGPRAPADVADVVIAPAVAPVAPEVVASADLPLADAASLVKAADLQRAAAEAAAAAAAEAARAAEQARLAEEARVAEQAKATAGGAVQMVTGRVTSGFGSRWGRAHQGLDIAAPIGTPIHVPLAGTVIDSGPASGFGQWVRVRHADGMVTVYGHINRSHVKKGQEVAAGEVIAEVGNRGRSTGPHLHIEVHTASGKKINPRPWLDEHGVRF